MLVAVDVDKFFGSFQALKGISLEMPAGEVPPSAADCYRFALSHPAVDVCMMGARTVDDIRENLRALDLGPPR